MKIMWETYYDLLLKYFDKYNRFPKNKEIFEEIDLGSWYCYNKTIYNLGIREKDGSIKYKTRHLRKDRVEKMDKLNLHKLSMKNSFDTKILLLKKYLLEHDGRYPKFEEEYEGIKLGAFVNRYAVMLKNGIVREDGSIFYKNSVVTKEQLNAFESINFSFEGAKTRSDDKFNDNLNRLKEFITINDRFPNDSETIDGFRIGKWVTSLRNTIKNGETMEDGSIKCLTYLLSKKNIDEILKLGIDLIPYKKSFENKVMKSTDDYNKTKGILLYIQRELLFEKKEFISKEDIKKLNNDFFNKI